jgi:cell division septum initiation protein DivIVA
VESNEPGDIHFDVVRRGYDREQVDERMRFLSAELATAEQALTAARDRAATLEDELASTRGQLGRRSPETGFGNRVEKILRLAEDEAAEIRQRATDEAAEIVERARAEAEQLVADATERAQQRSRDGEQELQRLTALHEDVRKRLRNTKKMLDENFDPSWHDA